MDWPQTHLFGYPLSLIQLGYLDIFSHNSIDSGSIQLDENLCKIISGFQDETTLFP